MAESSENVGFMLTWKITNFSLLHHEEFPCLVSPSFKVQMLGDTSWTLKLHPRFNGDVFIDLCRDNIGPEKVTVDLELFILRKNDVSVCVKKQNACFGRISFTRFPPLLDIISLLRDENRLFEDTVRIQCRIWNETTPHQVKCFAETQISCEKYTISLPLHSLFDDIFPSSREVLLKSVSEIYPDFKIIWTPQREKIEFKLQITENSFSIQVICVVFVGNKFSKTMQSKNRHFFRRSSETWTFLSEFKSVLSQTGLSDDETYSLEINLFASDSTKNSFIENTIYDPLLSTPKQTIQASSKYPLLKQLEKIYLKERLCDFTIQSGEKNLKIHKALFGAVSPVFAAMFETNMAEKQDSTVTISDIDTSILKKLIYYVYTGNIDEDHDDALKLYAAANKYQITDLKDSCAQIIASKMNVENFTDGLRLADLHQDKMIMKHAKIFIKENSKEVFQSEQWKLFMEYNSKVANEIMYEMLIHSI